MGHTIFQGDKVIEQEKEIINTIRTISGARSPYEVFTDWVHMFAVSISNSSDIIRTKNTAIREEEYMNISKRYQPEQLLNLCRINALLVECFEDEISDYLGEIYMALDIGNTNTGQFFTPFHLSYMSAKLSTPHDDVINMIEPSCGGGGMVIAAAKVIQDRGMNYQKVLRVKAKDLDFKAVYMSYIQFSLLGINGVIEQGDALNGKPVDSINKFFTPAWKGLLI